MDRDRKFNAVFSHAASLAAQGVTETFDDLAAWLNRNGFRTGYGTPYTGGRGVARLVHAVYAYAHDELGMGDAGAAPVAEAFTNRNGAFAYE
jgi:ABC-type uncharacterized transport system YnjBCD substrate-binding protein